MNDLFADLRGYTSLSEDAQSEVAGDMSDDKNSFKLSLRCHQLRAFSMICTLLDPRTGQHSTITVPAHVHSHLGLNILLVLGTVAVAQVMAPATAHAQCNSISNPTPPPPLVANFSNQSFGNDSPLVPYRVLSAGLSGCDGANGSYWEGESGKPGDPGQPGAQISSTNSGLTIIGGFTANGPNTDSFGAPIVSRGGNGGTGGASGYVLYDEISGGNGGAGGAGGDLTVTFGGTFVPDPVTGLARFGLVTSSFGGKGGDGGPNDIWGTFERVAGDGGAGASGGDVALVASGTIRASSGGAEARSSGGGGGAGADSFTNDLLDTTLGGAGGNGGTGGAASLQWLSGTVQSFGYGLRATSSGGAGGNGGAAGDPCCSSLTPQGGDGGVGGNAGTAGVLLSSGAITVTQTSGPVTGIHVDASGGDGGAGGRAYTGTSTASGNGGNGGTGGTASATVSGTVVLNGSAGVGQTSGQAVLVQSNGGSGGKAGDEGAGLGQAGGGGYAGAGGTAALTLGTATTPGILRTSGNFGHGAVVQSVGGAGGGGGSAGFFGSGGTGAAGGNGGQVTVSAPNTSVVATGTNAMALLAQSVGGGGGVGGDATGLAIGAGVAIGGNGALGGNGGPVTLDLTEGVFASTSTLGGAGVLAQSIGGLGGAGGSATLKGAGIFLLTIGGNAGAGGVGGTVNVNNSGLITSYGDHAGGVQAQSIGGGGGKGGAAVAFNVGSVIPTVSVAVGGQGGVGGTGGNVSVTNKGQITTYGADAYGVNIHSIGGGGGHGGMAAARAVNISGDPEIPSISLSAAIGGKGGSGNTAGTVALGNSGLITTAGDGAVGVMAQSIGGGGGNGGDSTAASYSAGPQGGVAISLSVAVGGAGGMGGTGGAVTINNSGLIATLGQDAYGVFAQSVGGGGGMGGAGDASASANNAKSSFGASLAIGGVGGTGGHAGVVDLTNSGAITTQGDGADAVFAQSVGGGGGAAGGGVATANGGKLSVAVGVGGSGGAGGNGDTATVANSGSIVTRGTDSIGISVQSIGGGGGKAGKGGATAGGTNPVSNAKSLFDILAGGLNFGQTVTNLGDGILQVGQIGQEIQATYDELNGIFSQPQAGKPNAGTSVNINVGVSVGGSGGAAGNGGAATATNTGQIATYGAQSDAVYAQSVGGGGGSGGAASSTDKAANDTPVQASVGVGGKGGAGGAGGPVTVTNGTGGRVLTQGVAAFGIFAQSVGGGGGEGSLAGTVNGSLKSLGVGIGGSGGGGGDGGVVTITTGDHTSGSTISTTGKHGIAIFAQSVGGGGGLVRTMTTDQTFDPSKIIINPQGRLADVHGLSLTIGGQDGSSGTGGGVNVLASGPVTTAGLNAHAILAQSIGGGGGMAVGGQVNLAPQGSGGAAGAGGDGGAVKVQLQPGAQISTRGAGAYGILAQSIGGGGGAAGDFSAPDRYQLGTVNAVKGSSGNGGVVSIAANAASVHTTGSYAPAIFAQSIGGGGGLINYKMPANGGGLQDVQSRGTAGGNGSGGPVNITLVNSRIVADGVGSAGILAQSDGTASSPIAVSVDRASLVQGGLTDPKIQPRNAQARDVAAIRLLGGTTNKITNAGTIRGDATPSAGTAILANGPSGNTAVANSGSIFGNVILDGSGSVIINLEGGIISAPTTLRLNGGVLQNAGTLHVGGIGAAGTTRLTGDLRQSSTGSLHIDIDPALGRADLLQISGRAALDGAIVVNPISLRKGTNGPVVTATGGLTHTAHLQVLSGPVFTHTALVIGNTLSIATDADFRSDDLGKSANQRGVAGHLQQIWDSSTLGFEQGFLGLSRFPDVSAYTQALDSLSGEVHASGVTVSYDQARQVQTSILARLREPLRKGPSLPLFVQGTYSAAYAADLPGTTPQAVAVTPASAAPSHALWGESFGSWGRTRSDGNAASLDTSTGGFILGADTALGDSFRVGLAGGFARTSFDVPGRLSSGSNESVFGALYGSGQWGAISVRLGASYAWHDIDTTRTVLFPGFGNMASASYDGSTVQAFGEVGYRIGWGRASLEPFVGASILRLHTDAFQERDGVAALTGHSQDQDLATTTLGVRGEVQVLADVPLLFKGQLGWRHAYGDVRPDILMAFAGGASPFSVAGVPVDRNALVAEAGLDWQASQDLSLGVAYRGQIGTRAQDHALTGNLTWRFETR